MKQITALTKTMRLLFFSSFFLMLLPFCLMAQKGDVSLDYYNKASALLNKKQYRQADSLYTISAKMYPHRDTYFNRAMCRKAMGDKNGFCNDLINAYKLGDQEAYKLFWQECGKSDSTYTDANKKPASKTNYVYKETRRSSKYSGENFYTRYNRTGELLLGYEIENSDTLYFSGKELKKAEYPGGNKEMMAFIQRNFKAPDYAVKAGMSGKIYMVFTISKVGAVEHVKVIKGLAGFNECDAEAVRVLKMMPTWKPAVYKNRVVKSKFNFPMNMKYTRKK